MGCLYGFRIENNEPFSANSIEFFHRRICLKWRNRLAKIRFVWFFRSENHRKLTNIFMRIHFRFSHDTHTHDQIYQHNSKFIRINCVLDLYLIVLHTHIQQRAGMYCIFFAPCHAPIRSIDFYFICSQCKAHIIYCEWKWTYFRWQLQNRQFRPQNRILNR